MAMAGCQTRDWRTVERHLRKAQQHVALGRKLVDKQHAVLLALQADDHATDVAKELLAKLEEIQSMHIADRARLLDELAQCTD